MVMGYGDKRGVRYGRVGSGSAALCRFVSWCMLVVVAAVFCVFRDGFVGGLRNTPISAVLSEYGHVVSATFLWNGSGGVECWCCGVLTSPLFPDPCSVLKVACARVGTHDDTHTTATLGRQTDIKHRLPLLFYFHNILDIISVIYPSSPSDELRPVYLSPGLYLPP